MDIQDIHKLKNKHNIKIYLFVTSENEVVRAHIPKTKMNGKTALNVINLLYSDNHYVLIKDLSKLLRAQITKHKISKLKLHTFCKI